MRVAGSVAPGIEHRAMRWGARRASLVVSSLAGPRVPLSLAGQPLGAVVPTQDDAVEIFADDGVIRRLDDGRQSEP